MVKYKLQSYSEVFDRWMTIGIYSEENIDYSLKIARYEYQHITFRKEVIA